MMPTYEQLNLLALALVAYAFLMVIYFIGLPIIGYKVARPFAKLFTQLILLFSNDTDFRHQLKTSPVADNSLIAVTKKEWRDILSLIPFIVFYMVTDMGSDTELFIYTACVVVCSLGFMLILVSAIHDQYVKQIQ